MHNEPVVVLVHYRARPGCEETARREIAALVARVVEREPDCLGITVLGRPDEPAQILLQETWTSRAAYLGSHREAPHLVEFIARAAAFLSGPPDISIWHRIVATPSADADERRAR